MKPQLFLLLIFGLASAEFGKQQINVKGKFKCAMDSKLAATTGRLVSGPWF
jgi:hypothetical protein